MTDLQPPIDQSYWVVPGRFLAGAYPGSVDPGEMTQKLKGLADVGVTLMVNLQEADETNAFGRPFIPYMEEIRKLARPKGRRVDFVRYPIRDMNIPTHRFLTEILDRIDRELDREGMVFVHCWGGRGRTGTVVGAWLIRRGLADPENVLQTIVNLRAQGLNIIGPSPETMEQKRLVNSWKYGQ